MISAGKIQKIGIFILVMFWIPVSGQFSLIVAAKQDENPNGIVSGNNEFALNLYTRLKDYPRIKAADGNLFFSPYSISTAFAMIYSGARGNTAKQIADVLHFPAVGYEQIAAGFGVLQDQLQAHPEAAGYQLNLADSLWGQKGYDFLPEFIDLNKKYFDAGLSELDFIQQPEEARKTINVWVEEHTKEKIKALIPPGTIDDLTRLILTNAIYFKGNWVIPFKEENTKPADFNVTEEKRIGVQMMYQKEKCKYAQTDDAQLLQIPYGLDEGSMLIMQISRESGNENTYGYSEAGKLTKEQLQELPQLSMLIILPRSVGDLDSIEKKLNPQTLQSYTQQMKEQEVKVYLPKFKMTCETIELKDLLIVMGMKDVYKPGAADFSGTSRQKDLFISNVLHKTYVEVNEKGTEAAAASALRMSIGLNEPPPPIFRADRPFVFMIRDNKTDIILFMGRLVNPSL